MNYPQDYINKVVCEDCISAMKNIPDNSIDLVITSPPYDKIRKYGNSWALNLSDLGKEIYRVLKDGSVCVMLIQDQTENFKKSLTSFRTIVDWVDNVGFNLFECNIYERSAQPGVWWNSRFRVDHEYMPIFTKGTRPKHFNKEHLKIEAKYGGKINCWAKEHAVRTTNNELKVEPRKINPKLKCRGTVWNYTRDRSLENKKKGNRSKHPATFCYQFVTDIIPTFTVENEIVLDPLCGSGTVLVGAKNLNRKYIGIDISREYCDIAEEWLLK